MTSNYESLALHYANEALILKAVATVHLETDTGIYQTGYVQLRWIIEK